MVEIILIVASIICTFVAAVIGYYLHIKKLIQESALDAINKAEDTDLIGEEKMQDAVESIYSLLPVVAKPFIHKEMLEIVIQKVFDKVEEYAQKQVSK